MMTRLQRAVPSGKAILDEEAVGDALSRQDDTGSE